MFSAEPSIDSIDYVVDTVDLDPEVLVARITGSATLAEEAVMPSAGVEEDLPSFVPGTKRLSDCSDQNVSDDEDSSRARRNKKRSRLGLVRAPFLPRAMRNKLNVISTGRSVYRGQKD